MAILIHAPSVAIVIGILVGLGVFFLKWNARKEWQTYVAVFIFGILSWFISLIILDRLF